MDQDAGFTDLGLKSEAMVKKYESKDINIPVLITEFSHHLGLAISIRGFGEKRFSKLLYLGLKSEAMVKIGKSEDYKKICFKNRKYIAHLCLVISIRGNEAKKNLLRFPTISNFHNLYSGKHF